MAERVALDRCQQVLEQVIQGKLDPSYYSGMVRDFEGTLEGLGTVGLDLLESVRELERKAIAAGLDLAILQETSRLVTRLLKVHTLSASIFCTPSPKLSRELIQWFSSNFRLDVTPNEVWLRDVDTSLVAIRWLSFRVDIAKNPHPLATLAESIARRKKKRKKDEEEEENRKEVEACHYDLTEAMCIHAASGQAGLLLKRLRRAHSSGEDIFVLMGDKRTGIEMKLFLNKEMSGTSYQKLMALAEEIRQLLYYMLAEAEWSGRQAGALVFAHLLFCIEVEFTRGKVQHLTVCPGFPTFPGSNEPVLGLYDRRRLYQAKSSDPDFVFDAEPSEGFRGLVKLVSRICRINNVALAPLRFVTDEGVELDVAVGEELVYSGRNSVVVSCRDQDGQRPSWVLKVAPGDDSRREERYHAVLDSLPGVRRLESSGRVEGGGVGLRFIQLAHFGERLRASHVVGGGGGRAEEFAEQACATIQGMHDLGVLHRDIKPDNFIVVGDALLLNDFDLSCDHADELQRCFVAGTPLFRSPRLVNGGVHDTVDDWMSLGLTFMYLLGVHRSEQTQVASLEEVEAAAWAPDVLKSQVAAGLQLIEQQRVEATEMKLRRKKVVQYVEESDESDEDADADPDDDE